MGRYHSRTTEVPGTGADARRGQKARTEREFIHSLEQAGQIRAIARHFGLQIISFQGARSNLSASWPAPDWKEMKSAVLNSSYQIQLKRKELAIQ